jgi:V/A-type H+/Na+-transporting ATPase subunit I
MREDIKKFLFIGPEEEKETFFKKAQALGIIHFIDFHQKARKQLPEDVDHVAKAIKILRGLPSSDQEENFHDFHADKIVSEILELQVKNEKLEEEERILRLEISRIEVFGDFSIEDIAYIKKEAGKTIQFYVGRPGLFHDTSAPDELIYITSEHNLDYYMAINDHHAVYDRLIEMKIDHSLHGLRSRHDQVQKDQHIVRQKLKGLSKYNEFLHHALIEKLNKYSLNDAQTYVQQTMDGLLFAVEGWVPVKKTKEVDQLVESQHIHAEEILIESADVIPTVLKNEGMGRLGEDLIKIYDTPSATDKDPSLWVLWSFALFFAFIVGDAGYGLVYLLFALFLRYKFPDLKGTGKRVLNLFTVLCVACIIWGTLMTSFFGMQIGPDSSLRKISLINWLVEKKADYIMTHQDENDYKNWIKKYPDIANVHTSSELMAYEHSKEGHVVLSRLSDNIMFELALCIGVIHLVISLLRYARRNIPSLGWAAFLIGAYLYIGYYLETPTFVNFALGIPMATGQSVGMPLMLGGIGFAWIASILIHGWKGLFEVMTLIQVFADTLSYLRLYALALAGAIVSVTINEIAVGLPLIAGVLLIVLSHFVNIVLGTMSGVIHGLRLNFLEWYHYSFEGGGKEYKPLNLKTD